IDGMSKYNTNDSLGSWTDYTGTNRFNFQITSSDMSIGIPNDVCCFVYPLNYTTIRGFDLSGASGRQVGAGDNYTVEYVHVHDIPAGAYGPNIMLGAAVVGGLNSGTVTISSGTNTVTGSGSHFQSEFTLGKLISVGYQLRHVASISSDTS